MADSGEEEEVSRDPQMPNSSNAASHTSGQQRCTPHREDVTPTSSAQYTSSNRASISDHLFHILNAKIHHSHSHSNKHPSSGSSSDPISTSTSDPTCPPSPTTRQILAASLTKTLFQPKMTERAKEHNKHLAWLWRRQEEAHARGDEEESERCLDEIDGVLGNLEDIVQLARTAESRKAPSGRSGSGSGSGRRRCRLRK